MVADKPVWITVDDIHRFHDIALTRFGGMSGVRDPGLVESACNSPRSHFYYDGIDDLLILAVRLCVAICKNHAFSDGNKRTGALALIEFLAINGYDLIMADDTTLGRLIESVIEGASTEEELVEHLDHFVYDRP